jgi:hypothetical protein
VLDCLSAAFGQSNYRKELRPGAHTRSESDVLRHFLTLAQMFHNKKDARLRLICLRGGPWQLFEAQLLQAITQRAKGDPQQARGGGLVVACLFQRLDEGIFLDIFHVVIQRDCTGCCV